METGDIGDFFFFFYKIVSVFIRSNLEHKALPKNVK